MYPNDPNRPNQPGLSNQPPQPQQSTQEWGGGASQSFYGSSQPSMQPQQSSPQQLEQSQQPFFQPEQPAFQLQQAQQDYQTVPLPMTPKKLATTRGPLVFVINEWMKQHWRLFLLILLGLTLLGITIFQIVYPNSRLLPGAQVDGAAVGGMRKEEAAKKLNELYGEVKMSVYFGTNDAAFMESKLKDMGISVLNENRVSQMEYPLLLKFIPGSIFWVNNMIKPGELEYSYDKTKIQTYTQGKVGDSCTIPAKDATLKQIDSQLQVVPSIPGGECDISEFQRIIAEARPVSDESENKIRIDSTETPAAIDDEKARTLADTLNQRLKDPMPISLGSETESVPGRIVMSWLDFKGDIPEETIDRANEAAKLTYSINADRIGDYLNAGIASKVVKKAGVSKVSTTDFKETSRVNGAGGTELDAPKIIASVTDYINSKTNQAVAVVHEVGPTTVYTRTYTPTSVGYNALLTQYAHDNPGEYGLAISEMSGVTNLRSGSYNTTAKFPSAGIDSLYIGYAVIMERYTNDLRANENIAGGRNPETCMNDMMQRADEACRIGFFTRLGYNKMVQRGNELGLKNTTFSNKDSSTTVEDVHKVMINLYKNQVGRTEGGQKILTLGRTTRITEGIPAGVKAGGVAHVVGEGGTSFNDAAVIYSTKGVYVLTVLTKDGSSWEKIAELTKKIEAFKQVKVPKGAV